MDIKYDWAITYKMCPFLTPPSFDSVDFDRYEIKMNNGYGQIYEYANPRKSIPVNEYEINKFKYIDKSSWKDDEYIIANFTLNYNRYNTILISNYFNFYEKIFCGTLDTITSFKYDNIIFDKNKKLPNEIIDKIKNYQTISTNDDIPKCDDTYQIVMNTLNQIYNEMIMEEKLEKQNEKINKLEIENQKLKKELKKIKNILKR